MHDDLVRPGGPATAQPGSSAPYLTPAGALLALGAAIVLCWPMLLTSAPLIYFDTVSYFTNGEEIWWRIIGAGYAIFHPEILAEAKAAAAGAGGAGGGSSTIRSLAYAAFFFPTSLTPIGLVLPCIIQTASVVWMFLGLVPPLDPGQRRRARAGFIACGLLSTLPWFASYAMPDILGAALPLYFGLALGRADNFGIGAKLMLGALACFAILSHYGHLPLSLALAVAVLGWRAYRHRLSVAGIAFCTVPVVGAFAINFAASLVLSAVAGQGGMAANDIQPPAGSGVASLQLAAAVASAPVAVLSPLDSPLDSPVPSPSPAMPAPAAARAPDAAAGASFAPNRVPVLLARSIEDGPGRWYLEQECREVDRYAICELFHPLPKRVYDILWSNDGLRSATPDQLARIRAEESEIVLGATLRYPLQQAAALARNTLYQMVLLGTGELLPWPDPANGDIHTVAPKNADNYDNPVLGLFDWITPVFTLLAFAVLAWRVATGRTQRFLAEIAVLTLFALFINAVIYGGLSAPVDRYQARLAWLIPALLALDLALSGRSPRGVAKAVPAG